MPAVVRRDRVAPELGVQQSGGVLFVQTPPRVMANHLGVVRYRLVLSPRPR